MLLGFAFVEGALVLVLEILGARAITPYFGTSHLVWTSQITAALAYLAAGYALGGRLARRPGAIGWVLAAAALWLGAIGFSRAPILTASAELAGVAAGSFLASSLLFAPAFLALGALGPVLVERVHGSASPGAGSSAGRVLFASTLGGLAGGWATALVLIPHVSLSAAFAGTAIATGLLSAAWMRSLERSARAVLLATAGAALLAWLAPAGARELGPSEARGAVIATLQGTTGLVQVLDVDAADARFLLVDGTVQGAVRKSDGESVVEFSDSLWRAGLGCHPRAESALVVGLGAGSLARSLASRGVRITAVELDPRVVEVARRHFGLPDSVEVVVADARAALRRETRRFDLVLLDVYRGESFPWHLATRQALSELRGRLSSRGCLVINSIVGADGTSPSADRLEAALLDTFSHVRVFHGGADAVLHNATLVASAASWDPSTLLAGRGAAHFAKERPASRRAEATTDDYSDLDRVDAPLRLAWRTALLAELDARTLID
ncbi:MAG: fused MFS/spermidine synthase [Polyangiaceae bacterium]|nr:fused MFS/spermidine synthase [Polyangiaceae bacterium]